MFLKKLTAAHLLRMIEADTYFKDIDTTIRDIVRWESIQAVETPEDTAKYDNGTEPATLLAILRVVAVTETMSINGVTALVAGVLLDTKLEEEFAKHNVRMKVKLERQRKYQHVRELLDSLGPKQ
tara:strand:- start:44 stop:418 length:375 start_codon:yes stop_codon:yes gene_type:complete